MIRVHEDVQPDSVLESFSKHVMPAVRPQWVGEKIRVSRKGFDGGYSNHIVSVSRQEGGDKHDIILIRINAQTLSLFFADRELEVSVMNALHKAGLNPPVYCQFNNAICYGYAPGRPLTLDDLGNPRILKSIAKTMAGYHTIDYSSFPPGHNWGEKISSLLPKSLPTSDEINSEILTAIGGSLDYLKQEFEDMTKVLDGFESPMVLCHNDVHVLNMIFNEEHDKVTFIDQEAAGIEHCSCDIGNFFRYFVGIFENLDFDRFPSEQLQKDFIRMYLEEKYALGGKQITDSVMDGEVDALYAESLKGGVIQILMESLVLLVIIDQGRLQGLTALKPQIEFLKLQMDHYKLRKKAVDI